MNAQAAENPPCGARVGREWGPKPSGFGDVTRSDHRFAMTRLDQFVDDELAASEVDRVALHLVHCPGCSGHVRFLLRVRAALHSHAGRGLL